MDAEQEHELQEDVAALVAWRSSVETRLHFLEERLTDPHDRAHLRALHRMTAIEEYRRGR